MPVCSHRRTSAVEVAEEERSITEFVEIWYSDRTRDNLAKIVIRHDS
jgi:hypothetical protein